MPKYLWILVPKTVSWSIERIASCLGSTVEKIVFPLDASKCVEMAMRAAEEIGSNDCVQLCSGDWVVHIDSTIAVAVSEYLSAYAFKIWSLPVITSAASLSSAGNSPLCLNRNIEHRASGTISYTILYVNNIEHDIVYNISIRYRIRYTYIELSRCFDIKSSACHSFDLPLRPHEIIFLVEMVPLHWFFATWAGNQQYHPVQVQKRYPS